MKPSRILRNPPSAIPAVLSVVPAPNSLSLSAAGVTVFDRVSLDTASRVSLVVMKVAFLAVLVLLLAARIRFIFFFLPNLTLPITN